MDHSEDTRLGLDGRAHPGRTHGAKPTKVVLVYPHIEGTAGYAIDFARLKMELAATAVRVVAVRYPASNMEGFGARLRLLKSLRRELAAVDVVHFVGFFFPEYLIAWRIVMGRGVPYVVSPLSNLQCYALERSRLKKHMFLLAGGARFLRRASAVHSLGSSETESILNLGFRGDIFELPLGLYTEECPDAPAARGRPKGRGYVLFFGRLDVFQKGLDLLLEGFELYCRNNPAGLDLIIAGRSWNASGEWLRERIASMPCLHRIVFLGETTDQHKFDLMRGARALIYPSRFDGPPRPLRDAIASGVFVLASRQSNIYPDLEKYRLGQFFDANRVSVSEAIRVAEIAAEAPTPGLGRSLLSWDRVAGRYADMYRTIAKH